MDHIKKKISYWYMRYLIVTELYMCEKWERNIFHGIALILLTILGVFNYFVMVGGIRLLRMVSAVESPQLPIDAPGDG